MLAEAEIVTVGEAALGTITVAVRVHPFASVTVTVYVPAPIPVTFAVVAALGIHK